MRAELDERELRVRVLLSVQRALLGEITPPMRAIEVEWSRDRIMIRVFTEGEVDDAMREDFDAGVVTQVVSDFPDPDRGDPQVAFEVVRCDAPTRIPVRGVLVFARAAGGST